MSNGTRRYLMVHFTIRFEPQVQHGTNNIIRLPILFNVVKAIENTLV